MSYLTGGSDRKPVHLRAPFLIAFVLVVAIFSVVVATSGSAATVDLYNESVTVDADTDTAYAAVNNTNSTASVNVTTTFVGVENATGAATETQISNSTDEVNASSELVVESAAVNGTKYDEVRVHVTFDNVTETVPASEIAVEAGTFQQVSGGGGGGGSSGLGLSTVEWAAILVAVVGLAYFAARE